MYIKAGKTRKRRKMATAASCFQGKETKGAGATISRGTPNGHRRAREEKIRKTGDKTTTTAKSGGGEVSWESLSNSPRHCTPCMRGIPIPISKIVKVCSQLYNSNGLCSEQGSLHKLTNSRCLHFQKIYDIRIMSLVISSPIRCYESF